MPSFQPNAIITRSDTHTPTYIAVMVVQHVEPSGFYFERAYTRSEFELGGQGWAVVGGLVSNLTSGEVGTIEPWPQCIAKGGTGVE